VSPADARVALLAAELARDWSAVERRLEEARSTDPAAGKAETAYVALALDHAYQAFEAMLLRLERAVGLSGRRGSNWHVEVLEEASLPVEGVRPAVFPSEARPAWHALLRFRHFLRHAYDAELDAAELTRNVAHLEVAVTSTRPYVAALRNALAQDPAPEGD